MAARAPPSSKGVHHVSPRQRVAILALGSLAAAPAIAVAADKAEKTRSEQAARAKLSKDDARYFERLAEADLAEVEADSRAPT